MNALPPPTAPRRFLFLQGLASPFFARLGAALADAGHGVEKLAFNGGDAMSWPRARIREYAGTPEAWPAALAALLAEGVTDLVLFGDGRPAHAIAIVVPSDVGSLRAKDGALAAEWRHALRDAMSPRWNDGWRPTAVGRDGRYVMEKR